jgi:hypothetical protein
MAGWDVPLVSFEKASVSETAVQKRFSTMYLEPHLATLVSKTYTRKIAEPNRFFMFHYEPYRIDLLPSADR